MMKNKVINFILVLACIIGMIPVQSVRADTITRIPSRMKEVAENEYLQLYFDEAETDVAVKIKSTGDVWFSNPVDSSKDELATDFYKKLMKSQISITYYNKNVQASEMNNYNDSIAEGQFEIEYLKDGLTISYTLGDMAEKIILPQVINEERFLGFTNKMEKSIQKKVTRNYTFLSLDTMKEKDKKTNLEAYPILNEHGIYVLKNSVKDYLKEELMLFFSEVGYTKEDMILDHEENGFELEDNKPWFTIPLTYTLEGENLIVTVDPSKITYNDDGYYLVNVKLLEYFGAAGKDDEGYIFVPDGSGALINLNNGKVNTASYSANVYGQDIAANAIARKKLELDDKMAIKMPVFGLKTEDKAWFAMIENGDAYANINADVAGRVNSYNNIYAGFKYLSSGAISMGDMIGINSFQMYSLPKFVEPYQIRYGFLKGEESTYSGMANYYRTYLEDKGVLSRHPIGETLPFYVEFIGAIERVKSFFGIKYNALESLTSFSQALGIIEELEATGISNIKVQYSGWTEGGLEGYAPTHVKKNTKLEKDNVDLSKYINTMEGKGIPLYFNTDFQYVYKNNALDGYSPNSLAPRYFDQSIVKTGRHLIPNGIIRRKNTNLISPYYVEEMANNFIAKSKKYDLPGVSVGDLGSNLYSDFIEKRHTDREAAVNANTSAMSLLNNHFQSGILLNNANSYAWDYAGDILEVPMSSNKLRIIDEEIPFYQMVIRGYIEYAGEPLNMSDFTTTLLKSVETGAGIYFQWIYENNSKLKDTDYDYLYSVNYDIWKDKAISTYKRVNEVFSDLQGQCIVGHEQLVDQVYLVTYEEGSQVIVNYNKEDIQIDGLVVPAQDFIVTGVKGSV